MKLNPDQIEQFNEMVRGAIECYQQNPSPPYVPDRLKPALEVLPDDFVIVPRFCVEKIRAAATLDLEARDGYGGAVITRERAMDGYWFYHMFVAAIDGDYGEYEDMYGPND